LRFWGKIYASKRDYFIACGNVGKVFQDEIGEEVEPRGKGVNEITYWVTDDLMDKWVELPLISPQHIIIARLILTVKCDIDRKIKYMFTGDLERRVKTYPKFRGKEKHLLKAQIVRISFGTELAAAS